MDINFELYKIFYHAARSGSFSAAAGELFITQSAVSQAIRGLEERTGSRLFRRKSRSVRLTGEGKLLYSHIEQAYNYIKTAERKLSEMRSLESGEVRIGVGDTICRHFLIPHLREFNRLYPKLKIQVVNRTSSQILDILKSGFIDFGVVTLPVKEKSVLVEEYISVEDVFVASGRFSHLKGRKIPLKELAGCPLLLLKGDSLTRRNLDELFEQNGISITPEIELESMELLAEFARIGLGVAHVLKESAAGLIASGELFAVETAEALPLRRLGIATTAGVPLSRASEKLVGLMRSAPARK